jgi:hypothetical protein
MKVSEDHEMIRGYLPESEIARQFCREISNGILATLREMSWQ